MNNKLYWILARRERATKQEGSWQLAGGMALLWGKEDIEPLRS